MIEEVLRVHGRIEEPRAIGNVEAVVLGLIERGVLRRKSNGRNVQRDWVEELICYGRLCASINIAGDLVQQQY